MTVLKEKSSAKNRRAEARGLTASEVLESRARYGSNKMTKKKGKSFISAFFENLSDPVIRVLLISLVINIIFTFHNIDWFETGGIALAILLATTISTLSEHSSRSAFEKLNAHAQSECRVRRDGEIVSILADEVVVGDVVLLSAGEKICADGLLISGKVFLDQSAMTGESRESRKSPVENPSELSLEYLKDELSPSSTYSCLRGCLVSSGEGEMLVMRVGDSSFLGGIVHELQVETRESPLKIRLSKLARQISTLGYGAAAVIALLSLFSAIFIQSDFSREVIISKLTDPRFLVGEILHSITLGLTVVIMAVPEGLPMMIAVVLASNVKKMLNDMVLVRKSTGIEAAGSMNILFTDKTGTLTRGKMSVDGLILANGTTVRSASELRKISPEIFQSFCENALYNSSAKVSNRRISGGNATERALVEAVKKHLIPDYSKIIDKLPFDSKIKYSSATLNKKTYIKGAPEVLSPHLSGALFPDGSVGDFDKYTIEHAISLAQREGKRVILMCETKSSVNAGYSRTASEMPYTNCRFICAVVICDELRREARASVETLKKAGIDVVMITGDGMLTAKSIAEQVGIVNSRQTLCLEHSELEKMTDDELTSALPHLALVARALPSDKSRLVRLSQAKELVVGMTGDGINDAPALRLSDVGFAMGSGSDVAKEAGDIVILDNDLASIVKAVLYGRNIFKSIRKFLVFQLTVNFSSALVCMLGPLFGFDTPITVSQMLWVNMVMDTLGGLAFAGEAPHKRVMREKPKRRDEPILNAYMVHQIFISGSFSVLISMLFLKHPFFTSHFRESENDLVLLSAFFALLIFLGVMQCINSRTDRLNLFSDINKNLTFVFIMALIALIQVSFVYFGGAVLRATPLYPAELFFTLACAVSAVPFEFLRKLLWRFTGHSDGF